MYRLDSSSIRRQRKPVFVRRKVSQKMMSFKALGNPLWRKSRLDPSSKGVGLFGSNNGVDPIEPPLDKISTDEFIDTFLDEDDAMPHGNVTSQGFSHVTDDPGISSPPRGQSAPPRADRNCSSAVSRISSGKVSTASFSKSRRARGRPVPVNRIDDDTDDLETVLDVRERPALYDETGVNTYDAACRKYRALPSATFRRKLAHATTMDLKHYGIGPRGAQAIAIPMVLNTKVTALCLKGNDLNRDGIKYIAKMMTENSYIQDLDLSDNHLKSYGANLIAQMLAENTALRRLNLAGNNFNDSDAEVMVKYIEEHSELKSINFSNNEFSDKAGIIFKHLLAENASLQELDLSWNHIRMRGGIEIARGVKENVGLKSLKLSWNGIGDPGALEMAQALKVNTLVDLDLSCNRVYAEGFLALVKALKGNEDLKTLKMSQNPIPEWAALAALEVLNNMEEIHIHTLDLGDVMLSTTFKTRLDEVQKRHTDFKCPFGYTDHYGKRKLRHFSLVEEALKAMKEYCVEMNMNIVELFSRFDQDGSMSVTHDEFKEGLRDAKIPLSQQHVEQLINALDQDGDGEIDFSELVLGAEMYDHVEKEEETP